MTKDGPASKQEKWKHFAEANQNEDNNINQEDDRELLNEVPSESPPENPPVSKQTETAQLKESHLRLMAEIQNVRDRAARDVSNAHRFGIEKLLRDLLPVVDSMVRALESIDPGLSAVRDGMQLTLDMFYNVLSKHGVSVIAPSVGAPFEPALHEAVSAQPARDSVISNTVIQLLQPGFALHGRVVRAAMVVVAVAA